FYQVESLGEYNHKGSGIGLALTKELVELHQGEIDAHSSEGENSGTEFIIRLPMGDAHLKPGEIVEHPGKPYKHKIHKEIPAIPPVTPVAPVDGGKLEALETGKEIILVVEDSADVRAYIRGALEPLYSVVEAKDGREGIQKALEIIPDLVISDIMMPEKDGYELCRVLKSEIRTSHIPIILLTAKASEENIVQGLETGADDYI
ncbi:MAG: response regulator, partial [bacterium]|nr:response regulator [bacterium]